MYQLREFLNRYDTIIFDMDGVITKEEQYWDVAALTVMEFINSDRYCGKEKINVSEMEDSVKEIRNKVFHNDDIIHILKNKGMNNNWDLAYVVFTYLIFSDCDFEKLYESITELPDDIIKVYDNVEKKLSERFKNEDCRRNGKLWMTMKNIFQEWFLGDELFRKTYGNEPVTCGKKGLCYNEEPIIDGVKLKEIFRLLKNDNKRLCIATGRPKAEALPALEKFGILEYIDTDSLICYDFVENAEKISCKTLTKPHPYMFLKAYFKKDYSDEMLAFGKYPREEIKNVLAVGDAGADIFASHGAGMDFCAVLTGISKEKARGFFEKEGSEYILNSLEDFLKDGN